MIFLILFWVIFSYNENISLSALHNVLKIRHFDYLN